jgi:hypothetical protein
VHIYTNAVHNSQKVETARFLSANEQKLIYIYMYMYIQNIIQPYKERKYLHATTWMCLKKKLNESSQTFKQNKECILSVFI